MKNQIKAVFFLLILIPSMLSGCIKKTDPFLPQEDIDIPLPIEDAILGDTEIVFKDPAIKEATLEYLGISEPITVNDVSSITYLFIREPVTYLDDLIYFSSLDTFEIQYFLGDDASTISKLVNLTWLSIFDAKNLINYEFLKDLKLNTLILANAGIRNEDFKYISEEISVLSLNSCPHLKNIDGMERFYNLKGLNYANNWITDTGLQGISKLTSLEELYLSYNLITDISALTPLKNLKIIDIGNNRISDISPLQTLINNNLSMIYELLPNPILDYSLIDNNNVTFVGVHTEYREYKEAFDIASQIVSRIDESLSNEEKYRALAKALCDHVSIESLDWDDLTIFSAYGALVNKKAVCQGYQLAYQMLCTIANLPCYAVYGYLYDTPHGWNIVELNGKFYNVDVTHMDNIYYGYVYDYFLKSDTFICELGYSEINKAPDLDCFDTSLDKVDY